MASAGFGGVCRLSSGGWGSRAGVRPGAGVRGPECVRGLGFAGRSASGLGFAGRSPGAGVFPPAAVRRTRAGRGPPPWASGEPPIGCGRDTVVHRELPLRIRQAGGRARPGEHRRVRQDRCRQVDPGQRDLRRTGRSDRHRRPGDHRLPPVPGPARLAGSDRHPGPGAGPRRRRDHQGAHQGGQGEPRQADSGADPHRVVLRPRHGPSLRGLRGAVRPDPRRPRSAGGAGAHPGADAGRAVPPGRGRAGPPAGSPAVADRGRPPLPDLRNEGPVRRSAALRLDGGSRGHLSPRSGVRPREPSPRPRRSMFSSRRPSRTRPSRPR